MLSLSIGESILRQRRKPRQGLGDDDVQYLLQKETLILTCFERKKPRFFATNAAHRHSQGPGGVSNVASISQGNGSKARIMYRKQVRTRKIHHVKETTTYGEVTQIALAELAMRSRNT